MKDTINNFDRRLNYIKAQLAGVEAIIIDVRGRRWPDFAVVPYLKQRARLRREHEAITVLKNKGSTKK